MANYKRKKSKTKVRCTICTPYRNGNSALSREVRRQNEADKLSTD